MLAIVLALGTSVAYGVANFLAPVLLRRHAFAAVLLTGQVAALLGSLLLLGISGEEAPRLGAVALAALAGLGNAVGLAFFYEAVRFGPVSIVAPVGATGAVLPVVVGIVGGDTLRGLQVAGIALAIGGAVLASRRSTAAVSEEHWDLRRCLTLAALSTLGFGVLLAALPGAADDGRVFWALTIQRVVIVAALAALVAARGQTFRRPAELPGRGRTDRLLLLAPGLLLLAGTLMYVLASERGQLSVVAVCGSLFPLVTVLMAVTVLGERISRWQALGAVGAVAGVCLIAI